MTKTWLGYVYREGIYGTPQILRNVEQVATFVKQNLEAEEVVVTDSGDNLVFRAVDGIDLYSELDALGVDLPAMYTEARQTDSEPVGPRESWEVLYDSIGLSTGEIAMRRCVKQACREARTVADVASLLEGTYFDARFVSQDGERFWDNFNSADFTAEIQTDTGAVMRVTMNRAARVRHVQSGEDVHLFALLDEPEG